MSAISPCLWFDTEAEEAARFYTSVFPSLKDRFGVSWQIVPRRLNELIADPGPGQGAARDGRDAEDGEDRCC